MAYKHSVLQIKHFPLMETSLKRQSFALYNYFHENDISEIIVKEIKRKPPPKSDFLLCSYNGCAPYKLFVYILDKCLFHCVYTNIDHLVGIINVKIEILKLSKLSIKIYYNWTSINSFMNLFLIFNGLYLLYQTLSH